MNRVGQLREEHGWDQAELGRRIGVKHATVSKYENEKLSLNAEILRKLAKVLDASADYILCISNQRRSEDAFQLSPEEHALVQTYRKLDERGRIAVKETATREARESLKKPDANVAKDVVA